MWVIPGLLTKILEGLVTVLLFRIQKQHLVIGPLRTVLLDFNAYGQKNMNRQEISALALILAGGLEDFGGGLMFNHL